MSLPLPVKGSPARALPDAAATPGAAGTPAAPASGESAGLSLRERQRLRTRNDLVGAALEVLRVRGLEEATIARIIAAAGTSRATLYAHFPEGRTQLLAEAYQVLGRRVLHSAHELRTHAKGTVERICASLGAMLELALEREWGLFYNVSGPQLVAEFGPGIGSSTTRAFIEAELEQAKARGEASPTVDAESAAVLLVGAIREAGIDAARNPQAATRRAAAFTALVRGLLAG